MKKLIALALTALLALALVPMAAFAAAEDNAFSMTAPTAYTNDITVEISGEKYLKVDIKLNNNSANFNSTWLLSSTGFTLKYDKTKLTYVSNSKELSKLYTYNLVENGFTHVKEKVYGGSYAVNTEDAGEVIFAFATDYGMYLDEGNVLFSIYFKLADTVAAGSIIDLTITDSDLGLVAPGYDADNKYVEPTVDAAEYTFEGKSGVLTVGSLPIDKSALQKEYDADKALYESATIGDPTKLPNNTVYLTTTNAAIDAAALAAAKKVLDDANATQTQVDAATLALKNAFIAPGTVKVNFTALYDALVAAQQFINSEEFKNCSAELQKKWTDAYNSGIAVYNDVRTSTQAQVDAAANTLNNLRKTGESTMVFLYAGLGVMALAGLALVLRRRFN